jgi:hypothetical protein
MQPTTVSQTDGLPIYWNILTLMKISGFHGSEDLHYGLLSDDIVYSGKWLLSLLTTWTSSQLHEKELHYLYFLTNIISVEQIKEN